MFLYVSPPALFVCLYVKRWVFGRFFYEGRGANVRVRSGEVTETE